MKVIDAGPPTARDDRAATQIVHDEPNARVLAFHLLPGQKVPAHSSDSTVIVQVLAGTGTFRGSSDEQVLETGGSAIFAPGEEHSMEAGASALHFLAILTPRPGG